MEDRLSSLSEEKKNAVVNAALEVFGTNESNGHPQTDRCKGRHLKRAAVLLF